MFVARLLILLVVVAVLLWLLKRLISEPSEAKKVTSQQSENMKQCKYCGVHVPESAIISIDDNPYCSQEHADLDQQQ